MGAAAAGPLSLATMGLSAFSSVLGGAGKQAAANAQAARLEQAAAYGKVQAAQTGAQLSEELNKTLDNIDVIRAASGIDPTSPTTAAIADRQKFLSDRQRTTAVDNILQQSRQNEADAAYSRAAGDFALKMGYLGAATNVAGAAATGFKSGTFGGGSSGGTGFSLTGTGGLY